MSFIPRSDKVDISVISLQSKFDGGRLVAQGDLQCNRFIQGQALAQDRRYLQRGTSRGTTLLTPVQAFLLRLFSCLLHKLDREPFPTTAVPPEYTPPVCRTAGMCTIDKNRLCRHDSANDRFATSKRRKPRQKQHHSKFRARKRHLHWFQPNRSECQIPTFPR